MNKNTVFNIILSLAVIVLFILNFSKDNESKVIEEPKKDVEKEKVDSLANDNIIQLDSSSTLKQTGNVKIGYFVLEELVSTCPYLTNKTKELVNMERSIMQSLQSKEQNLIEYQQKKQKEFEELDRKQLLSQSMVQRAQEDIMQRQQELQLEARREEERLGKKKQAFIQERDQIIFQAVQKLNEQLDLDYVLVDNMELRLVVPLSDRNNITKAVASYINSKYK